MTKKYALASKLVGFSSTTLRVQVLRSEGDYRWVITADLRDAGTKLVLDASQVRDEPDAVEQIERYEDAMITCCGQH